MRALQNMNGEVHIGQSGVSTLTAPLCAVLVHAPSRHF